MTTLRIAVGADEAGHAYREVLNADLQAERCEVEVVNLGVDAGVSSPDPTSHELWPTWSLTGVLSWIGVPPGGPAPPPPAAADAPVMPLAGHREREGTHGWRA